MIDAPPSVAPSPAFSRRICGFALDVLLLATLIVLPLAWMFDPLRLTCGVLKVSVSWGWKPIVVPLALLVLRAVLAERGLLARGFLSRAAAKKALAAWLMPWFFFMAIEGALALMRVQPQATSPIVIRGEEDIDTKTKEGDSKVILDPELLWRFAPGAGWDGIRINSLGFRDREFPAEKPAGTRRVIVMGDSCTAQGQPPYSALLHELLQWESPTDVPWQAFNTGVFGYSSMQGLRQFQNTVRHLQPDVVTLYYGWNDHWLYDRPDHLRMAVRLHPARAKIAAALQKKRFYGALARMAQPPAVTEAKGEDNRTYRVPHSVYRATLIQFIAEIRAVGATPLLITAPRRDLTPSVVRSGHARSVEEVHRVHAEYVDLTRAVAAETGTPLLDLAAVMEDPAHDALFSGDGIHFQQPGLQFIAEQLHAKLMELGAAGVLP
ncbi:MAG TPA: GDSL-type esterase/lipase family protein [Kiritimatiellia bacterium]|nr:GDSL-type esterase/lipase family protein [Kiritimatiellia bacterium]